MSGDERVFRKFSLRVIAATAVTAFVGILWLIFWFLVSRYLADYPEYMPRFEILAWSTLLFTFAGELSKGTIYMHILTMLRAFFFIVYFAYATDYGFFTLKIDDLTLTVEFMPLLALIIAINLFAMSKSLLQAIELASQSPKD